MRLREVKFIKGYTLFDLRLITGIHQSKLSLIERGYLQPTDDEKKKLAEALKTKPERIRW